MTFLFYQANEPFQDGVWPGTLLREEGCPLLKRITGNNLLYSSIYVKFALKILRL